MPYPTTSGNPVLAGSFGDALRACPPHGFRDAPTEIHSAVAAALNWFVVEAPVVCADHLLRLPPRPTGHVMFDLPAVDAASVVRPASFRRHVTDLRAAVEFIETPFWPHLNTLPLEEMNRINGDRTKGESPVSINRALLGDLLSDMVDARAWLINYGSRAGYWSYRWTARCLEAVALHSETARQNLATALKASASDRLHEHFDRTSAVTAEAAL